MKKQINTSGNWSQGKQEMEPYEISNEALIDKARSVLRPRKIGDRLVGDVGCALVTDQGNLYVVRLKELLPYHDWFHKVKGKKIVFDVKQRGTILKLEMRNKELEVGSGKKA